MLRQTLTLLTSFILMLGIGVFAVMYQVSAAASPTINYQGKLTDTAGVAVADGDYNMRFYLYNATGGATTTAIWTEELTSTDKVTVTNGLFSVMLGSTTALTSVDFNQALYLGVEIGGSTTPSWDGEMSPRKELGTVPAAFESFKLGGVASSSFLRSDAADAASGLLTFNGGFISTASSTISALTSVTATTTNLVVNGELFSDLTGLGFINSLGALTCATSDAATFGCLSSTDWSSFNNKVGTTSIDTYAELNAIVADVTITHNGLIDTSAELAAILGDETGSGFAVFSTNPLLNGFRSNASSTIGDGTATGGLTVSGYSTTTGNAYFAGLVGIGSNDPSAKLTLVGTAGQANNLFSVASSTISASSSAGSAQGLYSSIDSLGKTTITGRVLNPVEVGSVVDIGNAYAVAISGNYAYVADTSDGLEIIDISDPTNPVEVGSVDDGGLAYAVAISGNYAYVADFGDGLEIIDISDPTNPVEVGSVDNGGFAHSVAISGHYAYVADWTDGLEIIDISDPTNPVEVVSVDDGGSAYAVAISGNYAYVADAGDGLEIIDISDPTNPVEVGSVYDGGTAYAVAISGNYAYVADTSDGLEIIDISDPTNPVEVGSVDDGGTAYAVAISGNYAYVADSSDGLEIIDISDPTNPVEVGSVDDGGAAYGVAISGNYAYVADNTDGLEIIDIGALETANLYAGNILTDQLQVSQTAIFDEAIKVRGSANIGQSLFAQTGSFSKFSTTSANYFALSAALTDGNNSGITDILNLTHSASSTGADGIGAGLLFSLETDAGSATSSSRIASILTDASTSTPASALTFSNKNTAGALTEYMRLTASGYLGLGTTTPGAKLTIEYADGTDTGSRFLVGSSTEANLTVTSNGDVEVANGLYNAGITWATSSSSEANFWNSVTYGNGLYVAVSSDGTNRVMTSPDGINWTARSAAEANSWHSVTYGNGLFVAVSRDGTNRVMTSPDGITWTARSAAEANSWQSITYGNGLFVAVAYDGTNRVMTSPDGITWTARAASAANVWYSVTYGNGLFVAVAQTGGDRVMTSPDGITWTARSAAQGNVWYSVTYGNGLFVAVSFNGTNRVMTSPDGITWTAQSATEANFWYDITYGNGLFVAVSANGTNRVMTSPDGVNWTARENPIGSTAITYGNGRFVTMAGAVVTTSGSPERTELAHNNTYQGGMNIYGQLNIGTTTNGSNLLNIASLGTSYLNLTSAGLLGLGSSTPNQKLSITGNLALSGSFYDSSYNAGTSGMVLQTTGAGTSWVATSSLGFSDSFSTSAQLASLLSDETGTGFAVFSTNPLLSGFRSNASSTIGDGTATGGLTISGYSTTTGNAYFASNIGIGTSTDTSRFTIQGTAGDSSNLITLASSTGETLLSVSERGALELYQIDPVLVGSVDIPSITKSVAVSGNYAYVGSFAGLSIIDISDPANSSIITTLLDGGIANDVSVSGNYAYVADGGDGLEIIDISDPTNPVEVGSVDDGGTASGIFVSGNYAYVADYGDGLEIIDISDPTNPVEVGSVDDGDAARDVVVYGDYAYVADYTDGLEIIDISDPTNPVEVGQYDDGSFMTGVDVSGKYAYLADYYDGLVIIDISDPANPVLTASTTDSEGTSSVTISGNYAYVGDGSDGLEIIDISSSTNPVEVGQFDNGGAATAVVVSGNYAYVANESSYLLEVYDLGGIIAPTAEIGTLLANKIDTDSLNTESLNVRGSANIGQSLFAQTGSFSKFSTTSANYFALSAALTDGNNSGITDILNLTHSASSTGADGIGAGLLFSLETDAGSATSSSRIASILTDASTSTPASALTFSNKNTAGALTEFMRLTASGYLGLGTTTPGAKFTVQGTAGDSSNLFTLASSTGGSLFTVSSNGNVGIGTSTPFAKLSVDGDLALTGNIYDSNSSTGTAGYVLQTTNTGTSWVATSSLGIDGSADDLTDNSIEELSDVAAMTKNFGDLFYWNGSAWSDLATSSLNVNVGDTTGTLADGRFVKTGDWTGTFDGQEGTYYLDLANATGDTDDITEGATNLYWTNNRFDARLAATTTLPNLATLAGLTTVGTIGTGVWQGTAIGDAYLTKTGDWTGTFDGQEGSYYLSLANATGNTDNITEGATNLYWTNNRFDARLAATTTLPNLATLAGLTTVGTIGTGVWQGTAIGDAYLTKTGDWTGTFDGQEGSYYLSLANATGNTDNITEGATNLYWTNNRFDARLAATTTLPNLATLAGLTTVGTIGTGVWQGSVIDSTYLDTNVLLDSELSNSSQLAGLLSDETGTGFAVFSTNPLLNGFRSNASSTIGDGTAAGGLTISGYSTTTGNAYFAGLVGIGTSSPSALLTLEGTAGQANNLFSAASSTISASSSAGSAQGLYSSIDSLGKTTITGRVLNPVEVGSVDDGGNARGVAISGNYAYVADSGDGLEIIDISDPTNPVEVGSLDDGGNAYAVAISGNYAYVADWSDGLEIIDISDPTNPVEVGSVDDGGFATGVAISGNYAYVADYDDGLEIIDISDPTNPVEVGSVDDGENAFAVAISGNYAYVGDGNDGLEIIDISDPTNPVEVGSVDDGGFATGVAISGNYAYVADYDDGLEIIDISDPTNPVEVGSVDDGGLAYAVAISGNYAYVADDADGLEIIDISDPATPVEVGSLDDGGNARGVAISGNYAYVADNTDGLEIIDIGALETANLYAGNILTDQLQVSQTAIFDEAIKVRGSANIGQSLFAQTGSFSKFSTTSANYFALSAALTDGNNSGITDILNLTHSASSTGADGIGAGLLFSLETDAGSATSSSRIASILTDASTSTPASALTFSNKNTAGALTEYMRLTASGYLGLGTTTPGAKFTIQGTAGDSSNLFTLASSTGETLLSVSSRGALELYQIDPVLVGSVDTVGGAVGVMTIGNYSYIADGNEGLVIVDVSDPSNPLTVGSVDDGGSAKEVVVVGNYAYVADFADGLEIIDISDPSNPAEVGSHDSGGSYVGVVVQGSYAYIAKQTNGLEIIDISDPTNPVEVGTYDTAGSSFGVAVSGNYAYVADASTGLRIIDISDPTAPVETGVFNTSGASQKVAISGHYAYVADGSGGLSIIDIASSTLPVEMGSFNTAGTANGVVVSGNYAYIADSASGTLVMDISSSTNPVKVGEFYSGTGSAEGVSVSGNYAYIADDTDGLEIIHLGGITAPTAEIGTLLANRIDTNVIYADTSYISSGLNVGQNAMIGGDLAVRGALDIKGANEPVEVGSLDTTAANVVTVSGDIAYVADGSAGLKIIDISDKSNPVLLGSLDDGGVASEVKISGDYAYVADYTDGLEIIDISDPTNPVEVGSFYNGTGAARNVFISGNLAYVADSSAGLEIIDISDPTNPVELGSANDVNGAAYEVVVSGNYAYMADDGDGLEIIDISDPTNPVELINLDDGGNARGVAVSGNYAYVADGTDGLEIIDISDPSAPVEVGSLPITFSAYGVSVSGDYAYVSEEGGAGLGSLLIVDVSSSTNPIEVGQFDTIGTAYKATVYGNYVYLADGAEGIIILDIGGITAASAEIGTLLANRIDTNVIYADTSYISSGLNVGQNAMIGGALTITGNASSSLLSTNTNPALLVSSGYVGIGTSSPSAKLSLDSRAFSGSGVVGIDQYLETENTVESAVQYGNRYYLNASNTATTTIVGSMLRIEDDTAFGNTVRGLEVQANKGINTTGENTALSGFARTFGVRGVTTGDAGGSFEPAGGFFESEGTSQGNAIRGYSDTITSASLLALFQDTSAFTGTGLEMNFGNTSGSFSSTSSKYLDFQNSGSSVFTVSAFGTTTIGDGTTSNLAGLQIGFGGICVDNDGSCTASTSGRITSVESQTGNSDLAEMYFSNEELDSGEIVVLENNLSVERASKESNTPILGVVSTKPGLTLGFDDVSLNEGEKAYPIALSGRVPIKLSTENGPIVRGDYLMLSSIPGIAMKATGTGATIGISLEDFDDSRMYSDTFINQFGDDMTDPVYEPVLANADPRINDGCYFGGGSEAGEEPCVPLTSTTSLGQIEEVNNILEQESVEEQLEELAEERSDTEYLEDGQEVKVGQVVMFVQNGHRWLDSDMASAITSIVMTDTAGLEELAGIEEGRSAFKTVVDAIIGLWEKVKGIETRVDTLEAQNAELRAMILQLGGEESPVEETIDDGSDEETTEYEEEPVVVPPVETEETTSSSTVDTASTTPPVEEETTASSTDSGVEEVVEEVVTEETEPEVVEEEVVVESEPEPEVIEEIAEEPEVVEEVITEEPVVEPSPEPEPAPVE